MLTFYSIIITGDYRLHSKSSSTCKQQNPSCVGKSDGYHEKYQLSNSYFNGFKERLVNTVICEDDSLWNINQIIYKGQCRNLYEVPHKDGGLLSSCEGKMDGNYANEHPDLFFGERRDYFRVGRKCDAYYRCQGGVASAVKCPSGTTFNSVSKSCKPGNHSIGLDASSIAIQISKCTVFQTIWQSVRIQSSFLKLPINVKILQRSHADRDHK